VPLPGQEGGPGHSKLAPKRTVDHRFSLLGRAVAVDVGTVNTWRTAAVGWVDMTDEPMHLGNARGEWYYCFKHEKVETRDECRQMDRMGPYPTREDAENWQERVGARNEAWEDEEE